MTKPNSSPVGRYLMLPTACPNGAAGRSHMHTGAATSPDPEPVAGQSESEDAVL